MQRGRASPHRDRGGHTLGATARLRAVLRGLVAPHAQGHRAPGQHTLPLRVHEAVPARARALLVKRDAT